MNDYSKYEVLGDNDANGLIGRHNAFLRQWNRITSLTKTRIHKWEFAYRIHL